MAATKSKGRTDALLSRRVVEGLIADGRSIIIVDQRVLKVDPWLKYHPGGDKAIMHMVGRDATDEVNASVSTNKSCQKRVIQLTYRSVDSTPLKLGSKWNDIKLVV
jgi:hypothetical protein